MKFLPQLGAAVYLTIAFVLFFLGLITFREGERVKVSRLAAWMCFFAALGAFNAGVGLVIRSQFGNVPFFLQRISAVWELFFPTLLGFTLVYPTEHPLSIRFPKLIAWLYFPYAFHLVVLWFLPETASLGGFTLDWAHGLLAPLRILIAAGTAFLEMFLRFHASSFALVNLVFCLGALAFLARGYATQLDPRTRREGELVLFGLLVGVGTYALAFLAPRLLPFRVSPWIAHGLLITALVFGAAALAWAIIRYQFLGVRMILRRGVVFSLSVGLTIGLYLIGYGQIQRAAAALGKGAPAIQLLFLLVAIFLFHPLAHLLDTAIERLFARELVDARESLQELGEEVMSVLDPAELESRLEKRLLDGLNFRRVELWIRDPGGKWHQPAGMPERTLTARVPDFLPLVESLQAPAELGNLAPNSGNVVGGAFTDPYSPKAVVVPVRQRGELVGAVILEPSGHRRSSPEELRLLASLGRHVAVALENSRLHRESLERRRVEEELQIARNIQKQLLPAVCPRMSKIEVSAVNIPSRTVGGDIYDFLPQGDSRLGIALGDVSGKGVPAALLMANIQAAFRLLANQCTSPSQLVSTLNRHLARNTALDRYATFLYGILDAERGRFVFCNAGHNYPLLRRPDGTVRTFEHSDLVIGVLEEAEYNEETVEVSPGSFLLLYTDGVTEAFSPEGEEYGEERLKQLLETWDGHSADELRDAVLSAVQDFGPQAAFADDITLIVLHVL